MTRILVVDDQRDLLEEIRDILSFEGYDVLTTEKGVEAVALAQEHIPDLIICDIMMPELDGYGVLQRLQLDSATRFIPFIFLTAKSAKTDYRQGMDLGADDYLTKPFTHDELLSAVQTRLEKQTRTDEFYELRLEELRKSLVTTLPHELNTPLTGILGIGEMLAEEAHSLEPDEIQKLAQSVVKSGRRLQRLIENYLLYSELEVLRQDKENEAIIRHPGVQIDGRIIAELASEKAQEAQREDDLVLKTDTPAHLNIWTEYLHKIAAELIDNAFKFSETGTRVTVTTTANQESYMLSVTDYGRGMSSEQIKQIGGYVQFDRRHYEQQGSGMGLIIAKRLTELFDGQFTIESAQGRGTRVTVQLPLAGDEA